jgi:hypothetical protein
VVVKKMVVAVAVEKMVAKVVIGGAVVGAR